MTANQMIAEAADVSNPYQIGQTIGGILWSIVLIWGVIKTISVLRRPTSNRVCLSGLLCVLVGWTVLMAAQTLTKLGGLPQRPTAIFACFLAVPALLAAVVLGIVGLATFDSRHHKQGRPQAIWAIVLGSFNLLVLLGSFLFTLFGQSADDPPTIPVSGKIDRSEFNFQLSPSSDWVEMPPNTLNKEAVLSLRKKLSDICCLVIAEKIGTDLGVDQYKKIVLGHLAVNTERVIDQKEVAKSELSGVPFFRVQTSVILAAQRTRADYEHWIGVRNGYAWQMVFFTNKGDVAKLAKASEALARTFKVVDPNLAADIRRAVVDVTRPQFGYQTRLAGLGWREWDGSETNALDDYFCLKASGGICITPIATKVESPDLEALARGLLSTMDFNYDPGSELFVKREWTPQGGLSGMELTAERTVEKISYRYLFRIIRFKQGGILLSGWTRADNDIKDLENAFNAVRVHEPEGEQQLLSDKRKKALSLVLNSVALYYLKHSQIKDYAQWCIEASKLSDDPVILGNLADAHEKLGDAKKGLSTLAPSLTSHESNGYFNTRVARLQVLAGEAKAGNVRFLSLLDHKFNDEDSLLEWLKFLNSNGQQALALEAIQEWVKRLPSRSSRRWLGQVMASNNDLAGAVKVFEKLYGEFPNDLQLACDLGEYYNDAGESIKAAKIAEKLINDGQSPNRALMVLGWSQMDRKLYRDAKATFEKASRQAPDDDDIKNAISRASSALGQGSNSIIKEPIEPVVMPVALVDAVAQSSKPENFGADQPSCYLLHSTGFFFEPGRPWRKTIHRRVKVYNDQGAKEMSSVTLRFRSGAERIFVNNIRVMDAGGKLKSTGDISDCYITDEKSGIASDDKILNIQIPGVEAGCIVEWQATISSNGLTNTFPFTRHLFGSVKPIAVECVFVTGDVKQVKVEFARHGGVEHMESDKFEGWLASCEQPYQWEPWATRSEERRPMLWLGGDEGTWEKIGWDYLELIRDRLKPSDDVVIIAKQLTASKKSVPDKIGAILAKLRQDLSYKAIEFGVRGRMPNTPSETLRLRYGDCKDHAVLLHALLGAVGIESRLTLVNTEWMVQDKLPSADQFNHMIVHVPALGEGRWIDPTDKTLAGEQFQADDFWSSSALILDSPKPRFVVPVITAPTPDSCRIRSHRICTPDGQDWKVHETLTLTGYYASWMRNVFVDASEEQQQIKAQEMLSNLGPVRLEKFHFVNVSNASESAVIECEYRVTKVIETLGEESKGPLPALWEKDYLSIRPVRNRKTPFNWRYPLSFESVVEVKLPSNPEDKLEQDEANEFCVWGLNRLPGQSSWKFKFQAKLGKFPADDYTRFQNAWEAAYRSWDKHISWRVSDQ